MERKNETGRKTGDIKMFTGALSREQLIEKTKEIAYGLYQKRECAPGHQMDDWLEAERIVKRICK